MKSSVIRSIKLNNHPINSISEIPQTHRCILALINT